MVAVKILQDDSCHWYIIPVEEADRFEIMLEKIINSDGEDQNTIDDFEAEFGGYRTGGDVNLTQLYIKE